MAFWSSMVERLVPAPRITGSGYAIATETAPPRRTAQVNDDMGQGLPGAQRRLVDRPGGHRHLRQGDAALAGPRHVGGEAPDQGLAGFVEAEGGRGGRMERGEFPEVHFELFPIDDDGHWASSAPFVSVL